MQESLLQQEKHSTLQRRCRIEYGICAFNKVAADINAVDIGIAHSCILFCVMQIEFVLCFCRRKSVLSLRRAFLLSSQKARRRPRTGHN